MSRNEQDHGAGFAVGAITGAIIGGGMALLFAPKPGAELRGELSESMTSMREAVARRYRELAERAGVQVENLEERVDAATASFESGARSVLESAAEKTRSSVGHS